MTTDQVRKVIASGWEVSGIEEPIKHGFVEASTLSKIFSLSVNFQVKKIYRGKENQYVNASDEQEITEHENYVNLWKLCKSNNIPIKPIKR